MAFREGGGNVLWEALEPAHNGDEDILQAPALALAHHCSQNVAPSFSAIQRPGTSRLPSRLTPGAT